MDPGWLVTGGLVGARVAGIFLTLPVLCFKLYFTLKGGAEGSKFPQLDVPRMALRWCGNQKWGRRLVPRESSEGEELMNSLPDHVLNCAFGAETMSVLYG